MLQVVDDFENTGSESGAGVVAAPMPGKVIQVFTESGAVVAKGDPLIVMEAMKMEHTLVAAADGIITDIFHEIGDQVDEGALLINIDIEGAE